jgi:hypothetical protein
MSENLSPNAGIPQFRNEPVLVLVLSFVTCGLYLIYWNMKTAEVLNAVAKRELISPVIAAVGGCCMPLNVYFYYVAGEGLAALGAMIGKEEELKNKSTLLLILGFLITPVAAMIVQGHLNELFDRQA